MANFDIVPVGDNIWYPPANILFHGGKKLNSKISSEVKKKIEETMSVAIMAVGMNIRNQSEYLVKQADEKEQTPDVRTMRLIKEKNKPNIMEVQEIEVVTLTSHSDDEVDDFLKRTKLKKSYPKSTVILCHLNTDIKKGKSWKTIHDSIKGAVPNEVFILARVHQTKHVYHLVQVNPMLDIIEYDLEEEIKKQPKQKVLKMILGKDPILYPNGESHTPF